MTPLDLVQLTALMGLTEGRPEIRVGLIDGPVKTNHPDFSTSNIHEIGSQSRGTCLRVDSIACAHGTFMAGVLAAKRGTTAPAICAGCTLLIRPIFTDATGVGGSMPSATPDELAAALLDCLDAGAHVINLSAALARPNVGGQRQLEDVLDYTARCDTIIVAAAGNQGVLGSSVITRHPWVVPVVACDLEGRPLSESNIGRSIGIRGLRAPGERVTSTGVAGEPVTSGGTSIATPFVTGTVALLRSLFPKVSAARIRLAIAQDGARRASIIPPLLNAWMSHTILSRT